MDTHSHTFLSSSRPYSLAQPSTGSACAHTSTSSSTTSSTNEYSANRVTNKYKEAAHDATVECDAVGVDELEHREEHVGLELVDDDRRVVGAQRRAEARGQRAGHLASARQRQPIRARAARPSVNIALNTSQRADRMYLCAKIGFLLWPTRNLTSLHNEFSFSYRSRS